MMPNFHAASAQSIDTLERRAGRCGAWHSIEAHLAINNAVAPAPNPGTAAAEEKR